MVFFHIQKVGPPEVGRCERFASIVVFGSVFFFLPFPFLWKASFPGLGFLRSGEKEQKKYPDSGFFNFGRSLFVAGDGIGLGTGSPRHLLEPGVVGRIRRNVPQYGELEFRDRMLGLREQRAGKLYDESNQRLPPERKPGHPGGQYRWWNVRLHVGAPDHQREGAHDLWPGRGPDQGALRAGDMARLLDAGLGHRHQPVAGLR